MKITDHKLEGVDFVSTPKNTQAFTPGLPDTIIIHYTAGGSAASAIKTLSDPSVKASAHVVVGRDGVISQLVPFNIIAWHAGPSQYGNRIGFNQYAIGIEIDNAGLLEKRGDKYYSWFGRSYDASDVVQAVHRNESTPKYWHAYTEKQIEVVKDLCATLIQHYGIKYMLGHEEISPGRKIDPGPAFPLDKVRELLLSHALSDVTSEHLIGAEATVTSDMLNIRAEGSLQSDKIARPLMKGQKVKILGAKEGWYKVSTEITGWVSAKFIK